MFEEILAVGGGRRLAHWARPYCGLVAMSSSIAGELITESLDYDGGRAVTVYVPPVAPEAVVFAGDGQRRRDRPPASRHTSRAKPAGGRRVSRQVIWVGEAGTGRFW